MSDFSLLYKHYDAVSNLTNQLNESVIMLKRDFLSKSPDIKNAERLKVSDSELAKAKEEISTLLSALSTYVKNPEPDSDLYDLRENSVFKNQIMQSEQFKEQMEDTLSHLEANEELSAEDLKGLDKFISVLDNEAGTLFTKLRIGQRWLILLAHYMLTYYIELML